MNAKSALQVSVSEKRQRVGGVDPVQIRRLDEVFVLIVRGTVRIVEILHRSEGPIGSVAR